MSSEMRVTDEMVDSAVRVAVEWDGADAISPQVMRAALHAALLARTEAGADGAEPFGWWIECHGTDGDFGQFVTDRAFVELLRSHGVVERETALFTHPQDASGDAEVAWSVMRIGNDGAAYDPPNTRRAFTYEKQPGNIDASRLGRAADAAAIASAGDSIDRGLALLKELQALGFGVFHIGAMQAKEAK
jgi:hypothetical protein